MKRDKGEFGYIKSQKIKRGLITLVMFAIPIIIFLTGLFITKTRLNMFTFVAIMGCIPAARAATGFIMMLMQKPASEALKEKIERVNENVRILYDMTFTAYQKTVPVDAVAVSGTQVIGYVSSEKADLSFGEEHIREKKRFLDQLKQMNQKQSEHETTGSRKAEYICDVLRAIVL